jgi:hypothetical protein
MVEPDADRGDKGVARGGRDEGEGVVGRGRGVGDHWG